MEDFLRLKSAIPGVLDLLFGLAADTHLRESRNAVFAASGIKWPNCATQYRCSVSSVKDFYIPVKSACNTLDVFEENSPCLLFVAFAAL